MLIPTILLAATLAPPAPTPQNPKDTATVTATSDEQRRGQQSERQPSSSDRPHTVGIGGQLGVSNRGAGAGTRLFFGDRVGVNLNAFWSNGNRYTTTASQGSTYGAFPSVMFMLTKPNRDRAVDVRPYVGGGIGYISAPGRYSSTSLVERSSGTTEQAFGGVEVTFKEADWMTISGEEIYYRLPVRFVNSSVIDGFNYVVALHFYLK